MLPTPLTSHPFSSSPLPLTLFTPLLCGRDLLEDDGAVAKDLRRKVAELEE